jgi:AhpD family alkylhydroperoxidase
MRQQQDMAGFKEKRIFARSIKSTTPLCDDVEIGPALRLRFVRRSPATSELAKILQFRAHAQQVSETAQCVFRDIFSHHCSPARSLIRSAIGLRRKDIADRPLWAYSHINQQTEAIMHMMDWNQYRQQVFAGVTGLSKLSPETVKGYVALGGAGQKTGHLDAKTRELIALAVAISLRCDGCITVHTEAARKLGATKEEIAEALGVAVSVNAGAAIVYSTRTLDAYDAATEV